VSAALPQRTGRELSPLVLQILRAAEAPMHVYQLRRAMACRGRYEEQRLRDLLAYWLEAGVAVKERLNGMDHWRATGKLLQWERLGQVNGQAVTAEPRPGKDLRDAMLAVLRKSKRPLTRDELYVAIRCTSAAERNRTRHALAHLDRVDVLTRQMVDGVECWRATGKLMRAERSALQKGKRPARKRTKAIKTPKRVPVAPVCHRAPRVASVWDLGRGLAC
jgi:hypothetical protein